MANNCLVDFRIAGNEENVRGFIAICNGAGPNVFGRVYSLIPEESSVQRSEKDLSLISIFVQGDVAWSIKEGMIDAKPIGLETLCENMDLVVEGYSSEPGNGFQEHILCNKGELVIEDVVDYHEFYLDEMSPADVEDLSREEQVPVEALYHFAEANDGIYEQGGFGSDFGLYENLLGYFEDELETNKFFFDDELTFCEDKNRSCVDGYLMASRALVLDLAAQLSEKGLKQELTTMDNPSFYASLDVHTNEVSLYGGYDYFLANGEQSYASFTLPVSVQEADILRPKMEAYCQETNQHSCLDMVNSFRKEDGLSIIFPVSQKKPSLDSLCSNADKRRTEQLKFTEPLQRDAQLERS